MKLWIKRVLAAAWRATSPVRRPLVRRLNLSIETILIQALRAHVTPSLDRVEGAVKASAEEADLVLNNLIRELDRLQWQVELLQQGARDRGRPAAG